MTTEQIERYLSSHATPAYIFDIAELKQRVQSLRSSLPAQADLCYAMKANAFIVRELTECVPLFEVCSPGEYQICRALDIPPEMLVISGVSKTEADTEEMVRDMPGIRRYTVESERQLRMLHAAGARHRRRLPVLLRLTSGNQFGLDREILKKIIVQRDTLPWLDIEGIQFFSGTQKHSVKRLKRECDKLNELLDELESESDYHAREVEFGTGFPVFYFREEAFDEAEFLADFSSMLLPLTLRTHVTLEIGRSIAASCGTYLTTVVDKKTNKKENYAILDGGIHHLVYYGQTMAMKIPRWQILPARTADAAEESWNLCGSLCTINDLLVKQLPVANLEIGDVFAFENAGAYSMTEGISLFLSRDLPAVSLMREDGNFDDVRPITATYPLNTPNY